MNLDNFMALVLTAGKRALYFRFFEGILMNISTNFTLKTRFYDEFRVRGEGNSSEICRTIYYFQFKFRIKLQNDFTSSRHSLRASWTCFLENIHKRYLFC